MDARYTGVAHCQHTCSVHCGVLNLETVIGGHITLLSHSGNTVNVLVWNTKREWWGNSR